MNLYLFNNDRNIPMQSLKKVTSVIGIVFLFLFCFVCFEIYVPLDPGSNATVVFAVQKGWSDDNVATSLQKAKIIRSGYFFKLYSILTFKHSQLKAGQYSVSPKMSAYEIASKISDGDTIKDYAVILEGWNIKEIARYLESKNICKQDYFIALTKKNYSEEFDFLLDKPKTADLQGYLFPDSYEIDKGTTCEGLVASMLDNFGKKLTPQMRTEIKTQKKTIFNIVTMASLLEKEVRTLDDKKMVAGILWKRIAIGMPLQLDSTVIYATGRKDANITVKDLQVNSPYNTYKNYGLPKGPISNPGINSIIGAMHPKTSKYWYYLTDGKTIYSETLDQHSTARAEHL